MSKGKIALLLTVLLGVSTILGCSTLDNITANYTNSEYHEPCEITYMTWSLSADGLYPQNMIDAFMEKYPWITVNCKLDSMSQEEYINAQRMRLSSGKGIDVTTLYPSCYEEYIKNGYLEEITGSECLSNYSLASLDAVTVDGKVYAIPFAMDAIGVMYNKDMFEAHGWEVPTNIDEFKALCTEISAAGIAPTVNSAKDSWPLAHEIFPFMQRLYVDNPTIFEDIDAGKAKYTDEPFVNTFNEISDYFASGAVSGDAIKLSLEQAFKYFADGNAAMVCHGEWAQGAILQYKPKFSIGVFPIPYNAPGEKQISATEIGQLQAIAASSENKEAAQLFVDYMSSPEAAEAFSESLGNFSAVSGTRKPGMDEWGPILEANSIPFWYDQMSPDASSELFSQLKYLYTGEHTVDEVLKAVQDVQEAKSK